MALEKASRDLPAVPDDGEPVILEGTIVARPAPIRAVQVVARHRHTRTAARNVAYTGIGAAVTARRLWESRSAARYERYIRAAEAAGDHEAALAWDTQRVKFLKDRHQRRTDMVELPLKVALVLPKIALGALVVLIVIGVLLAIGSRNPAEIAAPIRTVAQITEWIAIAFSVSWGPFLLAAPWITVAVFWWVGRAYANASMTGWTVARKSDDDSGLVVTADTVVLALQHLPVPALKKAFKDGWTPAFHTMPVRDGRGYAAVCSLPLGVTAEMVADQRPVLARNVHRAEVEVWPSDAEKSGAGPAGTVAMWIADRGVLSKPAPEYPLLHEGTGDVFKGVPGGVSPRGDAITVPVVGQQPGRRRADGPGQVQRLPGRHARLPHSTRCAELGVHVLASNGDFDAYTPRLARYVRGAEDEHIEAAMRLTARAVRGSRPAAKAA